MSALGAAAISGLIGGGISTIGNLVGNGISFKQQKQLAADQFEYNKQLMQMQMDFNNPASQMQMYKNAGINPYAALGHTTSISGSSVGQGSAPSLGNLGSDAVQAMQKGFSLPSERDLTLANAQAALTQSQKNIADSAKASADTANINEDTKSKQLHNDILQYQSDDLKKQEQLKNDLLSEQIASTSANTMLTELQAYGQNILNTNQQKMIDQQLSESAARIELMRKEGKLNDAQAAAAYEQALKSAAERNGVEINNDILKRSANKIVNQNFSDAVYKHYDAQLKRKQVEAFGTDKIFDRVGKIIHGANEGSSSVRKIKMK